MYNQRKLLCACFFSLASICLVLSLSLALSFRYSLACLLSLELRVCMSLYMCSNCLTLTHISTGIVIVVLLLVL